MIFVKITIGVCLCCGVALVTMALREPRMEDDVWMGILGAVIVVISALAVYQMVQP